MLSYAYDHFNAPVWGSFCVLGSWILQIINTISSFPNSVAGSTSKGAVRFPDDDAPPGSPTRRDEQSDLCSLIAVREKDGCYLVKVLTQ